MYDVPSAMCDLKSAWLLAVRISDCGIGTLVSRPQTLHPKPQTLIKKATIHCVPSPGGKRETPKLDGPTFGCPGFAPPGLRQPCVCAEQHTRRGKYYLLRFVGVGAMMSDSLDLTPVPQRR